MIAPTMSHCRVIPRLGGGRIAVVALLSTCLLFQYIADAQVREIRRVLILNDLGAISSPGFAEIDQALVAGVQKSRYQIEFYQETLELTLFPDEVSQRRFREEFIRKYSGRKLDVIIAAGSDSLKFIAESHERFVRDTPIIFCTILWEIPDRLKPDMHFTGVFGRLRPEETLNAALHLLPGTKHVVVTGGMGKFDDRWEAIAKQSFQNYESKLDFTYLTDLTMPALLERLRHLPTNTIVYHTALTQDAAGERFIDSAQSVPLVASGANAPVFVMDDVDLRGGTVGGDLVNWADDARIAAQMAVRVLNGEKPEDIPIVTSNNVYMFDWGALRRWGLRESNLPPGSIVLNRPPNFWQLYRQYVLVGIFVILAQALAISALLWQRARRRKTETELARSNERLHLSMESGESVGWETDLVGKRAYWFGDVRNMFGISSDNFDGPAGDFYRYVHPEDKQRVSDAVANAMQNHAPFFKEFRIVRPDGTTRWIASRGKFGYRRNGEARRMLGVAVDITERKQAEEALSTVSRRLIEAHEEERTWIARELHDDIKALSHRLHSSKLEYLGLEAACAGFCRELSELQNVEIDFHSESVPKDLPKEVSVCVFRVLQEALQNGVKHSGSRHFQVSLRDDSNEVALTVRDSGVGFDPEQTINSHGLGLTSMKERLKLVDGQLFIDSKLQQGTTIHARVPLHPRRKSAGAVGQL